jgi:hypothetical protein
MRRSFVAVAVAVLLAAPPAFAQDEPVPDPDYGGSMQFVTADGTWDCRDKDGVVLGAIVLADERYAFIGPDGIVGGYGALRRLSDGPRVPTFVVLDGYLKDELGANGASMGGPVDDDQNYAGDLFLRLVISRDNQPVAREDQPECVRRELPGA